MIEQYRWRELPQVSFLSRQKFCSDKHTFVMTKDVFCSDKHVFVMTIFLLWQIWYLWQLLPMILQVYKSHMKEKNEWCVTSSVAVSPFI